MSKGEKMKSGDILLLTIKDVRLHKEERMIQGAQYGSYSSDYIAQFVEYPNGIAVVDSIAATTHPDWEKKTEKRANILTEELSGKRFLYVSRMYLLAKTLLKVLFNKIYFSHMKMRHLLSDYTCTTSIVSNIFNQPFKVEFYATRNNNIQMSFMWT